MSTRGLLAELWREITYLRTKSDEQQEIIAQLDGHPVTDFTYIHPLDLAELLNQDDVVEIFEEYLPAAPTPSWLWIGDKKYKQSPWVPRASGRHTIF